jgi:pyruvate/2-oxoglutarate/acetoin dehydrogenase E1 component
MRTITYREAIREALREEMLRDPAVFLIGEEIGIYGGAYAVTKGLLEEFGEDRVMDTPISEAVIAGAAVGAALAGTRPVAEIMYIDFVTHCMDQLVNQAAKIRYMTGGRAKAPMVLRTQAGGGRENAAQHSQSLEAWFTHVPGVRVVIPSTPYDAKGLLKTSIRSDDPVIFIEHKLLYNSKGEVPEGEYMIPLGVADVKRRGKDVTLVCYSRMVEFSLKAAEQLAGEGIDVEVVDPRSLNPLDIETIVASVRKTGRVVICHEACKTGGFGGEIAAQIIERAFDYLEAPIVRVAGKDVVTPNVQVLERMALPQVEDIVLGVRRCVKGL